jgi:two-component system chemotaxis response regulator CheB
LRAHQSGLTDLPRDVVVIGGASGSLVSLRRIAAALPADLPAIVCVAVHIDPWRKSDLPDLLTKAGRLPAVYPQNGERLEQGRVYIAPPDHHLLIDDTRAYVPRGPKENQRRPAINALFRSAAVMCRQRVVGVLLSGSVDDGAIGLSWIKRFGGVAIVQDPDEAAFSSMPEAALAAVEVDYCMAVADIPPLLARLSGTDGNRDVMMFHGAGKGNHADESND